MIRRICLFAGPGSGKSTLAAKIFAALKEQQIQVELINEYIKTWAYTGKVPKSYDQLYVFAKQLNSEDVILRHVPLLITDSPLLLNSAYPLHYQFRSADHLTALAQEFEKDYPALNLYIERTVQYQESGRYQDYEKAIEFDAFLQDYLSKNLTGPLHKVQVDKFDEIMSLVQSNIV